MKYAITIEVDVDELTFEMQVDNLTEPGSGLDWNVVRQTLKSAEARVANVVSERYKQGQTEIPGD